MASGRYRPRTQQILAACLVVIIGMALIGALILYPGSLGARQPIPFSHRVHAGVKEISCLMCHSYAVRGPVAGMPPVETCMLCHSRIIIHYPEMTVPLYYREGEPILWVRVSNLPDFVRFDHSMHLASRVDCGHCHGDVKAMDRIVLYQSFNMGFCIGCHRDYGATRDCFACHY